MASARVNPFAYDRFKQERVQTNPDHQKPLFLHPSFGHVIENLCGYGNYLHGEAISIGMRIAGKIAFDRGLWETEDAKRQNQLLKAYGLPTKIPKMDKKEIIRVLMGDKKVKGGKMRFILPTGIGSVDIFDDVKESEFLSYF